VPDAPTLKEAGWPATTAVFTGCCEIVAAARTVSVAPLLTTAPQGFETSTVYDPAWAAVTGGAMVYTAAVAPRMSTPLRRHWYSGAGEPEAVTLKLAPDPGQTATLWGCCEMLTGTLTVRVAESLVTMPHGLDTVTV
jgi:hypothetical protein